MTIEKLNIVVDDVSKWDAIVEEYNYLEGEKSGHLYDKIWIIASKNLQSIFGGPIELEIAINSSLEKIFVSYSCSMNDWYLSEIEKKISKEIYDSHGEEIRNFSNN